MQHLDLSPEDMRFVDNLRRLLENVFTYHRLDMRVECMAETWPISRRIACTIRFPNNMYINYMITLQELQHIREHGDMREFTVYSAMDIVHNYARKMIDEFYEDKRD